MEFSSYLFCTFFPYLKITPIIVLILHFVFQDTGEAGWWKGELNGKEGVFPDNFAVQINELDKDFPVSFYFSMIIL